MNDENTPAGLIAFQLSAYIKVYLDLIDQLTERGMKVEDAVNASFELIANYFNYANNNKLAEVSTGPMINFIPEEE